MSERSDKISKLRSDFDARTSYIKAKLSVLVPSKVRALRMKSNMPRQRDLAVAADMQQSRISMFETPGAANLTLETLAKLAAAFKVGLIVDFVPFSEMLRWENGYSQDAFDVTRIDDDTAFIRPEARTASNPLMFTGHSNQDSNEGILAETETNIGRIATLGARINAEVEAMSQPQMQAAAGGR